MASVLAALRGLDPAYALVLAWNGEAATAEAAPESPPIYGPEDAVIVLCDTTEGAAERDITEMIAFEAARAAAC